MDIDERKGFTIGTRGAKHPDERVRGQRKHDSGRADSDARLRIAVVLYSAKMTGARRQKIRLVNGFAGRGCSVDLVLVRALGPLLESVAPAVRIVELDGAAVRTAAALRVRSQGVLATALPSLVAYLRKSRPDVVMAGNTAASLLTGVAHRIVGAEPTRSVLCITNHLSGSRVPGASIEIRLARWILPWADVVVPVGDAVARDLAQIVPGLEAKLRTIHNPIIPEDLAERRRAPAPHPWFEDGGPPIVLGCGRLEPQKDFATLLRAFALVRDETAARLVILGGGPERKRLKSLARSLGVDAFVAFAGKVRNPFAAMARSDVFVLSSTWEGLPNALVEAMACGCPVVSTDAPGGSRNVLRDGALGPLVPPGDPRAMADAVIRVLRDPPRTAEPETRGGDFTAAKSVDAYLALFHAIRKVGLADA